MAKTLFVLLLIAGAAFLIYRQVSGPASEEVLQVKDLQDRFAIVINRFTSASGRSGLLGMDTTDQAETAVNQTLKIRSELADLRKRLTEPAAINKADKLFEKIEHFCKKNDILRP
jgi:hypothetical protein